MVGAVAMQSAVPALSPTHIRPHLESLLPLSKRPRALAATDAHDPEIFSWLLDPQASKRPVLVHAARALGDESVLPALLLRSNPSSVVRQEPPARRKDHVRTPPVGRSSPDSDSGSSALLHMARCASMDLSPSLPRPTPVHPRAHGEEVAARALFQMAVFTDPREVAQQAAGVALPLRRSPSTITTDHCTASRIASADNSPRAPTPASQSEAGTRE